MTPLSVEHRFYDWRTGVRRAERVVNTAADDDAGTDVFSLDVASITTANLASQEEGAKMVDLDGGATTVNFAYLHNWK